jgi:anaerobic selenocysteine-containing dehydrogenase
MAPGLANRWGLAPALLRKKSALSFRRPSHAMYFQRNSVVGDDVEIKPYSGPAGGWGSVKAVRDILTQEEVALLGSKILLKQNKTDGFACVSCSWAKPASPHPFEFCENGAKATAWEITTKTTTPEFFSKHTLTELRTWSDMGLEDNGRLTHPMRYDATRDK